MSKIFNLPTDSIKQIKFPTPIDKHCNKFQILLDITFTKFAKLSKSTLLSQHKCSPKKENTESEENS